MSNQLTTTNEEGLKPSEIKRNQVSAIVPQGLGGVQQFAEFIAGSSLVPSEYRGKADDIAVATMHGLELGLKPMQALQSIAVIRGKPSIYGDAALALVRSTGELEYIDEYIRGSLPDNEACAVCELKREGYKEREFTFSVADAKRAGLWKKKGPWQDYPKRMLTFRARGFALRDVFGDVLKGLYIYEEARDIPRSDEPVDLEPVDTTESTAGHISEAKLEQYREQLEATAPEDMAVRLEKMGATIQDWPKPAQEQMRDLAAPYRKKVQRVNDFVTGAKEAMQEGPEALDAHLKSIDEKLEGIGEQWQAYAERKVDEVHQRFIEAQESASEAETEAKAQEKAETQELFDGGEK